MSLTFKRPSPKRLKPKPEAADTPQQFPAGYKQVRHPNGAVTMIRVTPKIKGKAAVKQAKRARMKANG